MIFLRFGLEAYDHVAVHLDEAAIRVPGKAFVARFLAVKPATASSFRPRFRMVSIMPGIEAREPERTETSSGSAESRTSAHFLFDEGMPCLTSASISLRVSAS